MKIIEEQSTDPPYKKVQIFDIKLDAVTNQRLVNVNKTKLYLLPCLKEYGKEFIEKFQNVYKVAAGIGDFIAEKAGKRYEKHVFVLLDTTIAHIHFRSFLEWIREQSYYEDDYVFDNIQKTRYHMVVIRLPEQYYGSFYRFKKGEYSKMFSKEQVDKFFENHPKAVKVFIKDHNYRIVFTEKVNEYLGNEGIYRLTPEEWEGELEFPPEDKTEVFNNYLKD